MLYVDGKLQSALEICQHNLGPFNYTLEVTTSKGQNHVLTILSISLGINTHTEPGEYDLKGITGRVWLGSQDITCRGSLATQANAPRRKMFQVYTTEGTKRVGQWLEEVCNSVSGLVPVHIRRERRLLTSPWYGRYGLRLHVPKWGESWSLLVSKDRWYVQRYYFIPQSLLKDTGNMLTLIEELRAPAPGNVKLVQSTVVVPVWEILHGKCYTTFELSVGLPCAH